MQALSVIVGASLVIAVAITQKLWRQLIFLLLPSIIVVGYIRHGFTSRFHQDPLWFMFMVVIFYFLILSIISAIGGIYIFFSKFEGSNIEDIYKKIKISIRDAAY